MTQPNTTGSVAPSDPRLSTGPDRTRRRLLAGVVAGPFFLVAWLAQAVTRDGFDPSRHPISLLSLGPSGWVQVTSFVVTGLLYLVCAVALGRSWTGPGSTWGPRLLAGFGLGLLLAGVFVTDPGAGFPPGAPAGAPIERSWHGLLHEVGFVLAQLCWTAAALVLARRFGRTGRPGWRAACLAALAAALAVALWPHPDSMAARLVVATAVQLGLVTAVAAGPWLRSVPAPGAGTAGSELGRG